MPVGEEDSGLPFGLLTASVAADTTAAASRAERDRELRGPQEIFRANSRLTKAEVGPAIKVALVRKNRRIKHADDYIYIYIIIIIIIAVHA